MSRAGSAGMSLETTARMHWCISQIRERAAELQAIERELDGGYWVPQSDAETALYHEKNAAIIAFSAINYALSANVDPHTRYNIGSALMQMTHALVGAAERAAAPGARKATR